MAVDRCKFVPNRSSVEQPLVFKRIQKRFDRCSWNRSIQLLRRIGRERGRVNGFMQQLQDRGLRVRKAKITRCYWILDDDDRFALMLLRGEFKI